MGRKVRVDVSSCTLETMTLKPFVGCRPDPRESDRGRVFVHTHTDTHVHVTYPQVNLEEETCKPNVGKDPLIPTYNPGRPRRPLPVPQIGEEVGWKRKLRNNVRIDETATRNLVESRVQGLLRTSLRDTPPPKRFVLCPPVPNTSFVQKGDRDEDETKPGRIESRSDTLIGG